MAAGRAGSRLLRGPLAHPAYRRYWAAGLLSFTAFWVQLIARSWMVQELSGSPFMVAMIPATMMLPMLFLSLPAGVMADRLDRRRVVLATEALALLGYIALSVVVATGAVEVWHILAFSLATGIGRAIAGPARLALVPTLVPRGEARGAIALSSLVFTVAQIVGPAIGGVMLARGGSETALFTSIVFMAPAWLLYLSVPSMGRPGARRPSGDMMKALKGGIAFTLRDPTLRWLMLSGLVVAVTLNTWAALTPTFAAETLAMGPAALGTLTFAAGAGALVGSVLVVLISGRIAYRKVETAAVILFAAAVAGFAASPWLAAAVVAAVFAGMAQTLFFVTNMTVAQLATGDEMRGRVMGVRFLLFGFQPVGVLALGALAEAIGVRAALYWFAAAGLGAFGLVQLLGSRHYVATAIRALPGPDLKVRLPRTPGVRVPRR